MDVDEVTFPALVVADDGWVDLVEKKEAICTSSLSAIRKFRKRKGIVLYDSRDRGWKVESIVPLKRENAAIRLLHELLNSVVAVRVVVSPLTVSPLQVTRDVLMEAIDADDDILTQFTNASELKSAINQAQSFESLVGVLKAKRAI